MIHAAVSHAFSSINLVFSDGRVHAQATLLRINRFLLVRKPDFTTNQQNIKSTDFTTYQQVLQKNQRILCNKSTDFATNQQILHQINRFYSKSTYFTTYQHILDNPKRVVVRKRGQQFQYIAPKTQIFQKPNQPTQRSGFTACGPEWQITVNFSFVSSLPAILSRTTDT